MSDVAKLKPHEGKKVPRTVSVVVEVDADIDASDLREQGWHHENECPAAPGPIADEGSLAAAYWAVLVELHHEAHGPESITICRSRPCASLELEQLRGVA